MHVGQVRVRVWVQDGAVAAHHAVLFEHAHLVDNPALHAVSGLKDCTVYLVLDVHCALAGAAEDQVGCVLSFSTNLCLCDARLVLVVEVCAECLHVHFLAFELGPDQSVEFDAIPEQDYEHTFVEDRPPGGHDGQLEQHGGDILELVVEHLHCLFISVLHRH